MTENYKESSQQIYNEAVKLAPMSIVDVPQKFQNKELWDIIMDMDLGVCAYLLTRLSPTCLSTDMCEHFVDTQCNLLQYVPKELVTIKMCENAINQYAYTIRFVPSNILTIKMCRIAVTQAVETFKYVPLEFRTVEICEIIVRKHGSFLKYVPEESKTEQICEIAISNYGGALLYVPKKLISEKMYKIVIKEHCPNLFFNQEIIKANEMHNILFEKFEFPKNISNDIKNKISSLYDGQFEDKENSLVFRLSFSKESKESESCNKKRKLI